MFLCSLIEELYTKEENDKTGCNFNFGHYCITEKIVRYFVKYLIVQKLKLTRKDAFKECSKEGIFMTKAEKIHGKKTKFL